MGNRGVGLFNRQILYGYVVLYVTLVSYVTAIDIYTCATNNDVMNARLFVVNTSKYIKYILTIRDM